MILVENYPCSNGFEARQRERYWYELLKANLNSNYPNRSNEEFKKIIITITKKLY
jgi:hypothetical protein